LSTVIEVVDTVTTVVEVDDTQATIDVTNYIYQISSQVTGIQGGRGEAGATGATGPAGPAGPTGATGPSIGTVARRTSNIAIANTETVVLSFSAAANTIVVGDVFRFTGYATRTGTTSAAAILRIRIGANTLTGNIASTVTASSATTNAYRFEAIVTCRTTGASGTVVGASSALYSGGTASQSTTAAVTVNTSATRLVEATFISGSVDNTFTFESAMLEKLPA
jgi:hypothetical protein